MNSVDILDESDLYYIGSLCYGVDRTLSSFGSVRIQQWVSVGDMRGEQKMKPNVAYYMGRAHYT